MRKLPKKFIILFKRWKNHRFRNHSILVIAVIAVLMLFQNCQQRSGIAINGSQAAVPIAVNVPFSQSVPGLPIVPPPATTPPNNPVVQNTSLFSYTQNSAPASPLKILFVIDDSMSMSQTQQELKSGIAGMVNALQGSNAKFYVATTSIAYQNGSWSSSNLRNFLLRYTQDGVSYPSISSIDKTRPYIWHEEKDGQQTIYGFTMPTLTTLSDKLVVGTSGYEVSSGLIEFAKVLSISPIVTSQPYFNLGDTVLTVMVSDANDMTFEKDALSTGGWPSDGSSFPSFYGSRRQKHLGIGITRSIYDGDYFYISNPSSNLVFKDSMLMTYCEKRRLSDGQISDQYDIISSAEGINNAADKAEAEQYVRSLATCDRVRTIPITNGTATQNGGSTFHDQIDCKPENLQTNSTSLLPKYKSAQGLRDLIAAIGGPSHTLCINIYMNAHSAGYDEYPEQEALYNRMYPNGPVVYADLNSTADKTPLKNFQLNALKQLISERIGADRFYFSAIVNDGSCPIGLSQSVGTRYIQFAQMFGSKGKVLPICRPAEYSASLQQTAAQIQGLTAAQFNLNTSVTINWVKVQTGSTQVTLDASQYQLINNNTTLNVIPGALHDGDQLTVNWSPR